MDLSFLQFLAFIGASLNGTLDWDYVTAVREEWSGPFVLKGILHPDDAMRAFMDRQGVVPGDLRSAVRSTLDELRRAIG